jgi:DNA repair exonuclease SbcCD ATPase subunit
VCFGITTILDNNVDPKPDLLDKLEEASKTFNEVMKSIEDKSEQYYNSLTKEQQLDAFCAISRRIYRGEIEQRGSYRYVLYDVFGFGTEAYAQAQCAGYLAIHNSIYSGQNPDDHVKVDVLTREVERLKKKYKSMEHDGGHYNTAIGVLEERIQEIVKTM